jgi:nitroreductase
MMNTLVAASTSFTDGSARRPKREKRMSEMVRERRSTSAFSPAPVLEEDLQRILRAGLEAPSSYNMQPWRFVVVRDADQRKRLRAAALGQEAVERAPVVIVACGDTEGWRDNLEEVLTIGRDHGFDVESQIERKRQNVTRDLSSHPNISMWVTKQTMIAATTMMWMAEALGYDTGPMEGFDEEQVREVLGIPEHVRVIVMLAVGRLQGEDGQYPGRLPAARTVFAERYGRPASVESEAL